MFTFMQPVSEDITRDKYFLHGEKSVEEVFGGVATESSSIEINKDLWKEIFYEEMIEGRLTPAGRILANARPDSPMKNFHNCFVIPISDSMEAIYTALLEDSLIGKAGGGVGFNVSKLRPKGAKISKGGESSGVMSFLEVFNASAKAIHTGGNRRSAHITILNIDHPDIEEFITYKRGDENGRLTQFNISVGITDKFIEAVKADADWDLVFDGKVYKTVKAKYLYNLITDNMFLYNEPGILYLDEVARNNNGWYKYDIDATNPCVTGDTLILTDRGNVPIESVVGQKVNIWNGFEYSEVEPRITGYDQEIYDIEFSNGSKLSCTPYHKFVLKDQSRIEAKDLKVDDTLSKWNFPIIEGKEELVNAYTQGFFSGDGYIHQSDGRLGITLYNEKKELTSYLVYNSLNIQKDANTNGKKEKIFLNVSGLLISDKNFVPDSRYNINSRLEWFAGILDSDGTRNSKDGGIAISSVDYDFLISIKNMLMTLGVHSTVSLVRDRKTSMMPDGNGGLKEYKVKKEYRIVVSAGMVTTLRGIGLTTHRVNIANNINRVASRFVKVRSISKRSEREAKVYCVTEPKNHTVIFGGVMTSNCGEQPLPPYSSCCLSAINLSSLVKNPFTDEAEFDFDTFETSVAIGVRFLDDILDVSEYPIDKIKEMVLSERRIGLGYTGMGDMLAKMKMAYGSPESMELNEKIAILFRDSSYLASIQLAKEKGPFPTYDEKILESGFIQRLPEHIKEGIRKYGLRNVALNTIAPTGCLVPESIVHTSDGLLTLDELIPNYKDYEDGTWIPKERLGALNEREFYKEVKNTFINGFKPTKKVFTKSGVDIEGTPNHKFRVLDRSKTDEFIWKELQELSVGDNIVYKIGGYERKENKRLILPDYAKHPNEKDINLPKEITPEFAFFLGLYNADGSTHNKGIRINLNHLSNESIEVVELIKNLFNWDSGIIDNGRNCDSVYISSQRLLNFLEINDLIKNKALDINIPKAVRQSSKESILSYLDGYFYGDGSSTGNTMYIDTYSKKNAQQLAIVMRAVGINSSITTYDKSLDENSFSNNLAYRVYWKKYGSIGEERVERYIKKDLKDKVKYLRNFGNGLFIDEVVSVEDSNNYTLDLEVPDGRTYIANSYVSHNTASLTIGNNCSSGIEPIFALEYTRNVRQPDDTFIPQKVYNKAWLEYIQFLGETPKEVPYFFKTADEISLDESVQMQALWQKYIDASISKTITLPDDCTIDEYRNLFMKTYEAKLKGYTTYNPKGYLKPILTKEEKKDETVTEETRYAKKRPENLPCDIYEMMVNKKRMVVLVGLMNDKPYEVFLTEDPDNTINVLKEKQGTIQKVKISKELSRYDLHITGKKGDLVLQNITQVFDDDYAIMCRLASLYLRHENPLQFLVEQLNRTRGFDTFSKTLYRVLKKYLDGEVVLSSQGVCPECGTKLQYMEGCVTCPSCGFSKC